MHRSVERLRRRRSVVTAECVVNAWARRGHAPTPPPPAAQALCLLTSRSVRSECARERNSPEGSAGEDRGHPSPHSWGCLWGRASTSLGRSRSRNWGEFGQFRNRPNPSERHIGRTEVSQIWPDFAPNRRMPEFGRICPVFGKLWPDIVPNWLLLLELDQISGHSSPHSWGWVRRRVGRGHSSPRS